LKAVGGGTTVDARSYADWCKLAEVVTYVKEDQKVIVYGALLAGPAKNPPGHTLAGGGSRSFSRSIDFPINSTLFSDSRNTTLSFGVGAGRLARVGHIDEWH
jgi:hypothetical protein